MSYTLKVILTSLASWLAVVLVCVGVSFFSSDGYALLGGMLVGFFLGGAIALGLFITAAVILLGKMDGKGKGRQRNTDVLDAGKPSGLIPYQERGLAFLAAGGIILLVGGSVCFSMV